MKTFVSIILSMITVLAMASQPDRIFTSDCRDAFSVNNPEIPVEEQVKTDLVSGQWSQGEDVQVYFNEDGTSDWLKRESDGQWSYTQHHWTVEKTANGPTLILQTPAHVQRQYFVEPTCDGVSLFSPDYRESITLGYQPFDRNTRSQEVTRSVYGEWEHTLTPDQLKELDILDVQNMDHQRARVRLYLSKNGTFSKELLCASANIYLRETGTWKVSRDGQFLLFNDLDGSRIPNSRCIRVKYLELDEMVLEQALAFAKTGKQTSTQDFYFNKQ
jgi:hypothetical protein